MAASFGVFGYSIKTVELFTKDVVNGLEITYVDSSGKLKTFSIGNRVGEQDKFTVENGEFINFVSGSRINYHGESCIGQLKFKTNLGKTHGPYGPGGGNPSDIPIEFNKIIGLVSLDGQYVNAIATCLPLN